MSLFCKLPAWSRITLTVVFLAAAIVVGIAGRPSAVLAATSLLLLIFGAWRLSRLRVFMLLIIMMPLLIGLLLAGVDWHLPFLRHYSAGLFSVVSVLLFMDAVRIEEWINFVRKSASRFGFQDVSPVLIGTAVGIVSLSLSIREQRACRKLAGTFRWRTKSRVSAFLDSLALPFYSAVEFHEFIDEALRRWSSEGRRREPAQSADADLEVQALSSVSFGNSIFIAQLADVYEFPYFTDLVRASPITSRLTERWEGVLAGLGKEGSALEVNGRTVQLTRQLLRAGLKVTATETMRAFREDLCVLQQEHVSSLTIAAGSPFATSQSCFDFVLFYRNAFLETINEIDVNDLLNKLSNLSRPGTRLFFTYPELETLATEGTIFAGRIPGIGEIDYRYAQYACVAGVVKARLAYTVRQENDSHSVRVPLRFRAPNLSEILVQAERAGFDHKISAMPQAVLLFPGDLSLIEFRRR